MKAKVELKIRPFRTPNYIIVGEAKTGVGNSLPLKYFDEATLHRLCDDFREEIFKKAKKPLHLNEKEIS